MRILVTAAATTAVVVTAIAPAGAAYRRVTAPAATSGWAGTATKALPLVSAVDLGAVPASMPLRLVIGLRLRDPIGAMTIVRREHTKGDSMYYKTLTPAQFTSAYGPTGTQVNAVGNYLVSHSFTNITAEPNNLVITANATAAQASAAFNTEIHAFKQFGHVIYAQVKPAQVPAALGGTVAAVLGLNNIALRPSFKVHAGRSAVPAAAPDACLATVIPTTSDCARAYTARDFQAAYSGTDYTVVNHTHSYNGKNSVTGSGDAIAVFAEGNLAQVLPDLRTFEKANNLPQAAYSVVPVGIASPDVAGLDEWDLDSQSSTGIADQVKHLYMYDTTSLTDSDTGLEFSRFATQNIAREGNASFGECESFPYADGAMVLDDELFNEAAAQGQTVFVSSGDNGSGCPVALSTGVPASGPPQVSYPASSPYVVAVGGTSLVSDATTAAYGGEKAWEGSGGGPSIFESEPYWQMGIATIPGQAALRQVPDVAMSADENISPAIVYVNGVLTDVGGTSLASPLTMGVWARLMTAHGDEMGFASPNFYLEYVQSPAPTIPAVPAGPPGFLTSPVGGFHDLYIGTNGAFQVTPRYDLVTGLGSLDIGHQTVDIDIP